MEYVFLSYRILNNLRLRWKTEFALKFLTVLNIIFTIGIFEQLVFALKTVCAWIHCMEYVFLSFKILNNLRLPWKTKFALKFFTVLKYFLSFRIFDNFSLPCKQSLPWIFRAGGAAASYATGYGFGVTMCGLLQ